MLSAMHGGSDHDEETEGPRRRLNGPSRRTGAGAQPDGRAAEADRLAGRTGALGGEEGRHAMISATKGLPVTVSRGKVTRRTWVYHGHKRTAYVYDVQVTGRRVRRQYPTRAEAQTA